MSKGKFVVGALVGAVAGIIAGVLTAPKAGKEMRADFKEKAVDLKAGAMKRGGDIKATFDESKEKTKESEDV